MIDQDKPFNRDAYPITRNIGGGNEQTEKTQVVPVTPEETRNDPGLACKHPEKHTQSTETHGINGGGHASYCDPRRGACLGIYGGNQQFQQRQSGINESTSLGARDYIY